MIGRIERITGELPDGTPLYELMTKGMSGWRSRNWWTGAEGEDYGCTAELDCYCRSRSSYRTGEWERVNVA